MGAIAGSIPVRGSVNNQDRIEIIRWAHLDCIAKLIDRLLEAAGKPAVKRSRDTAKQIGGKKSKKQFRNR